MSRPLVIPIHKGSLSRSVVASNLRTLGITGEEFEEYLK